MVDLKGQYEKIKEEIDKAILNVIDSTAFINGPEVQNFQKGLEAYLNVKHVIPLCKWDRCFAGFDDGIGIEAGR